MDGDTLGVRVIPPVVQFKDTEVTVVQRMSVTVKNVSRSSREIRFYSPQDKVVNKLYAYVFDANGPQSCSI